MNAQEPATGDSPASRAPIELTDEALAIHRAALVIDGHNDLPWKLRQQRRTDLKGFDLRQPQPELETDFPRLRTGNVGAQFWSAYVPADTIRSGDAAVRTLEQIDLIHRLVRAYPDELEIAASADDVERIWQSGKIASMIGIEGGHSIEDSLGVLRTFYALGARYMTLTHSDTLSWADSATDQSRHGGLAPFGIEVIREMNRLGMLVDISHVSFDTMRMALRVTRAPLIASHSSAYAVAAHPRNVPDDVLHLVRDNGGVIMVNFFSGFVVPESAAAMAEMFDARRELRARFAGDDAGFTAAWEQWQSEHPMKPGTVHDVVDHIDHMVRVAGVEHVGLGSDFDGVSLLPEQLHDVSCYPYITQELLNRGYSADDIHLILGRNVLRAWQRAEAVARAWSE